MIDDNCLPKIPENWMWTRLGEITLVMDTDHKMPKGVEKGIFFISPKDFAENYSIDFKKAKNISEEDFQRISKKCKPEIGDLIYSRIGTIGKVRKVPSDIKFHISYSLCIIRPAIPLKQSNFLFWLMQSPFTLEQAFAKRRSIGVPDLGLGDIKNFLIPIPPLAEQYRIATKIEELFSRLDAGVDALHKAQAQLKRYRQAVLKAAVEGRLTEEWRKEHPEVEPSDKLLEQISKERRFFWKNGTFSRKSIGEERKKNTKSKEPYAPNSIDLPKLPESWAWATIDQLSAYERNSITDGPFGSNLKTSHYTSNGPRVIRLQNIGKCKFIDEKAHISEDHFKKLKKHAVYPKDIIIAALGNPAPRACLIPEWIGDAIVKADCIRLKVVEGKISVNYVMYSLNSFPTQKRTEEVIHGVGRPRLNLGEIRNILIPLPPTEEQKLISDEIERIFSIADRVDDIINARIKYSESLRQSILKRAFEGKLVPQDPSDEPASILLKRIKAEKSKGTTQPKRARKSRSPAQPRTKTLGEFASS